MKGAVYTRYGPQDVVQITDVEKPSPNDNEVLIKVRAASVNPYDRHFMRGTPYGVRIVAGLRKPKITKLGADVAGQVEAVGRNTMQFKPGDQVFGICKGAFAEYVCAPESALVMKPGNVTFEQAACVPIAAFTALQGLRDKGRVPPGQNVLINGASGGVGTFAVQIAKGVWRRRDWRMQYEEYGYDPIHRRRSGHRLHARELHQERATLRRVLRLHRATFVVGMQARPESQKGYMSGPAVRAISG
jgi:D-arabinose 1-dehydrogenase-like Zn-dependent alcohol dehydrogenase